MEVAEVKLDGHHQPITIGQYLSLEPSLRPAELTCAGTVTVTGQPCRGLVFPKAIHGGPVAPHFASRNHGDGCDHAAPRRACWIEADADTVANVLQLTGTAARHERSLQRPSHSPASTAAAPRASLRTVLRALTGAGLPPELVVRWHQQRPLLAYEFFIHLGSAVTDRDQDRGYWGAITTVHHHELTGSVHLVPMTGARIVIDSRTSLALAAEGASGFADLDPGSMVLAVGPLRRAHSGRAYVLINQPSALAWL